MKKKFVLFIILFCISLPDFANLSLRINAVGYAGEYTDSESHLQYLKARYYDPQEMRFISRDSYLLINRYAYAGGNPIMNVDPSGHINKNITYGINAFTTLLGTFGAIGTSREICCDANAQIISRADKALAVGLQGGAVFLGVLAMIAQSQDNDRAALALTIMSSVFAVAAAVQTYRILAMARAPLHQPIPLDIPDNEAGEPGPYILQASPPNAVHINDEDFEHMGKAEITPIDANRIGVKTPQAREIAIRAGQRENLELPPSEVNFYKHSDGRYFAAYEGKVYSTNQYEVESFLEIGHLEGQPTPDGGLVLRKFNFEQEGKEDI